MWRGWILWFGNLLACREVFLVDALGFCRNLRHGKEVMAWIRIVTP